MRWSIVAELQRPPAQRSCLIAPARAVEHERLIEIHEGEPDRIVFSCEQRASAIKQFEGAIDLLSLARRERQVRDRPAGFVLQFELFEPRERSAGKVRRFVPVS